MKRLFIPLLQGIRPEIIDTVRENMGLTKEGKKKSSVIGGGEYIPKANEEVVPMSDISKEDFKKMMSGH